MKKHSLDHTSSNTEDEKARFSLGILYKKLTVHATENRNFLSNTGIYPITFACCNNFTHYIVQTPTIPTTLTTTWSTNTILLLLALLRCSLWDLHVGKSQIVALQWGFVRGFLSVSLRYHVLPLKRWPHTQSHLDLLPNKLNRLCSKAWNILVAFFLPSLSLSPVFKTPVTSTSGNTLASPPTPCIVIHFCQPAW